MIQLPFMIPNLMKKPFSSSLQIQLALIYKNRTEEDDNGEKTLFVEYNNSEVHQTVDLFHFVCLSCWYVYS